MIGMPGEQGMPGRPGQRGLPGKEVRTLIEYLSHLNLLSSLPGTSWP